MDAANVYQWNEAHLYGSSRLGILRTEVTMSSATVPNFISKMNNLKCRLEKLRTQQPSR